MPSARNVLAVTGPRIRLRPAVAAVALPVAVLASLALPSGVASAEGVAGTTVVGELVQAWPELASPTAAAEAPLSWIETAAGDSVRVSSPDVADLPPGSTVSVTLGDEVEDGADADGADQAREVLASDVVAPPETSPVVAPSLNGTLTNEVTVVLVAPGGITDDGTEAEDVAALVDGAVADFWSEQTDGTIALGVAATHGWIETAAGCSDPTRLWNEAASTVGFVSGPGRHLLLYVPPGAPGCAYALAEVGSSPVSGGRLYVTDLSTSVTAHEFGHNFGLGHSAGSQCDGTVEDGACRTTGYRDYYDVMGASWERYGSLNVVHAARLGLLPGAAQQALAVTGSTSTVTLAPVSGRSGTRALRLTSTEGTDYWLEYRPATGADAWLATTGNGYRLESGVLLRRADTFPNSSVLLDGSPSVAAGWDQDMQATLPVGAAVAVSGGDFAVTVQQVGPDGAVLTVASAAPGAGVASPAPAPAPAGPGSVPGGVLSAEGDGHVHSEVPVVAPMGGTWFWAPDTAGLTTEPRTPALDGASDGSSLTALVVPLAATALLAATLLLVRRLRRPLAR